MWEGSPLPQAPRAKRFRQGGVGGVGLDEIDVIFLCAWLAAPVALRGSRPELGDIDDDNDVRQTQMTPGVRGAEPGSGLMRCQGFSGVALFLSFGGGETGEVQVAGRRLRRSGG